MIMPESASISISRTITPTRIDLGEFGPKTEITFYTCSLQSCPDKTALDKCPNCLQRRHEGTSCSLRCAAHSE